MNDTWLPKGGPGTDTTSESAKDVAAHQEQLRSAADELREIKDGLGTEIDRGAKAFLALTDGGMKGFASEKTLKMFAENWKTKSKALGKRCGYLATGVDGAASAYAQVDENNAVTIDSSGQLVEVN